VPESHRFSFEQNGIILIVQSIARMTRYARRGPERNVFSRPKNKKTGWQVIS